MLKPQHLLQAAIMQAAIAGVSSVHSSGILQMDLRPPDIRVTEDGKVLIASNSGSQLPGYAYGSSHVIWVVGTQKIVNNIDDGMKRIDQYVLPLESERAHKAYGVPGSFVSKLLIFNRENPGRITMILVKQPLGF